MKSYTLFLVLFVIALIVFFPLAVIWALNTLFALSIGYTFWTWLAALLLCSVVGGSQVSSSSKSR